MRAAKTLIRLCGPHSDPSINLFCYLALLYIQTRLNRDGMNVVPYI